MAAKFTTNIENIIENTLSREEGQFPKVKVRNSRKIFNESIMRCLVQCLSETTASTLEVCKVMTNIANMVFNQEWKMPERGEDDHDTDNEEEEPENSSDDEHCDSFSPKKTSHLHFQVAVQCAILMTLQL